MWKEFQQYCEAFRAEDLNYLIREPYVMLGTIALGLLLLWLLYRIRPRRKIKAFKGDTGPVEISKHALLDLVRSACEQLPEVRKPGIRIRARRKLHLFVRIRVDGSARLRDTASFLQNHIKDALENNLGVENLGTIEVMVTGIRTAAPKKFDLNQRGDKATETPNPAETPKTRETPKPVETPEATPAAPAPATSGTAPRKTPLPTTGRPPEAPTPTAKPGPARPSPGRPDLNPSERKDPSAAAKPTKPEPEKKDPKQ